MLLDSEITMQLGLKLKNRQSIQQLLGETIFCLKLESIQLHPASNETQFLASYQYVFPDFTDGDSLFSHHLSELNRGE